MSTALYGVRETALCVCVCARARARARAGRGGGACKVVILVSEGLLQLHVVLLPAVRVAQHRVRLVQQNADVVPCHNTPAG